MTRRLPVLLSVAALSAFAAACGDEEPEPAAAGSAGMEMSAPEQASRDIVGVAQGEPRLSTPVDAVTAADLAPTLQGRGPFTVFAPTNRALRRQEPVARVLRHRAERMAADLRDGQTITTVRGAELTVSIDGDRMMVGDATVVMPVVDASNGTVRVIDTVLRPEA